MSYYYKYNFTSPSSIFAIVKEELKSYFDTGTIDDLMFPTYVNKCLSKLGRGTYSIKETVLNINNFIDRLPDNFHAVREAWLCTEVNGFPYQSANSFYSQAASATTIQVSPMVIGDVSCLNPECTNGCDECMPNIVKAVYKTNQEFSRVYRRHYLLKPGSISAKESCDVEYTNTWEMRSDAVPVRSASPFSSSYDSFDIHDNKFVTNFRTGVVQLIFYAVDVDDHGVQMIPDNYRIKEYIEAFIKYKMFETLSNQVSDETFNQIQQKLAYYEAKSNEAYILALTELRSQTVNDKQRRIIQSLNRHKMYQLPSGLKRRRN